MRWFLLLLAPLLLGACHAAAGVAAGVAAADVASIAVFHRGLLDIAVSGITGRDCSIVHWDRDEPYCSPREPPPAPPPYCTRSLGSVDCWAEPGLLRNPGREVADGPRVLTAAQERDRTHRWPDFGF